MAAVGMDEPRDSRWSIVWKDWMRRFRDRSVERRAARVRRKAWKALSRIDDATLADIGIERREVECELGQRRREH